MIAPGAATRVLALARTRGWRVATAESCTGGMIAAALTDIAGSSDVVEAGLVTYSNAAKVALLGVAEQTLADHGAVSEPVAREMALGALQATAADVAVSVTGVAGPGGTAAKPEGMVCFGLAIRGGDVATETHRFGAIGREAVRGETVRHALYLLEQAAGPQ
ncbi:CinA family protein [Oceanomicrobium pacificus]|uniref:Nicotinamide-nucleotide amidohydrolase family protein n=1 Tax=Oceanomicrobium pacificus TaxID=2692916 RepID=A0A6B0TSN6_9RHOB|nr:nicotinamide-nucleotide amidohydrolase family protein [Oceanomicrobium pacificus]MXU65769.1 nicotinamide-nucleotide amidohydrolase family protein [Oceanomicrobium pacificus]